MKQRRKINNAVSKMGGKQGSKRITVTNKQSPRKPNKRHTTPAKNILQEPELTYSGSIPAANILAYTLIAGKPVIQFKKQGAPVHTISFDEKVNIINSGITKKQLLELKDRFEFNLETLSRILDITDRTIQNKPNDYVFTGTVAEKILGLSELYSYGIEVFDERENFVKWINIPSPVLGRKKPVELFSTMIGMQQVKQELGRIEYGVF